MDNNKKQYIKNTLNKMDKRAPKVSDLKALPKAVSSSVSPNRFGKISNMSSTEAQKKSTPTPFEIVKDGAKNILKKSIDTVVGSAKKVGNFIGSPLEKEFKIQDEQNKKWQQEAQDDAAGVYKGSDEENKAYQPPELKAMKKKWALGNVGK